MNIKARRHAAVQLARIFASEEGCAAFREIGHVPGQPIMVVEPDDKLSEVFSRLYAEKFPSPALLAVAHPDLFHVITLTANAAQTKLEEDGNHEVNMSSTIGILLDYIAARGNGSLTFAASWGMTAVASSREVAVHAAAGS